MTVHNADTCQHRDCNGGTMTDPQERGGATAENRLWSYADLLLEVSKLRAQLATLTAENKRLTTEAEQNAHWRYEAASRHTFEANPNMPDQCVVVIGQVERPWGEGSDRICGLWRRFHLTSTLTAENKRLLTWKDQLVEQNTHLLAEAGRLKQQLINQHDEIQQLTADLASAREQIAELKADVQRGHEWQRGYADRLIESQAQCDQARAQCERMLTTLYEIERMPFGFEAELHVMALAALDQQAQPQEVHR